MLGNLRVAALGADRVDFAEHFLGDEFEFSSGRLGQVLDTLELIEMTLEADDFFGDVATLGEDADLADNVGQFDRDFVVDQYFVQPLGQPLAITFDDRGRALFNFAQMVDNRLAVDGQVVGHGAAFFGPHDGQAIVRCFECFENQRPVTRRVDLISGFFVNHAGQVEQLIDADGRNRAANLLLLADLPQLADVAQQHLGVDASLFGPCGAFDAAIDHHGAAFDFAAQIALDLRLQRAVAIGRAQVELKALGVDRADLDRDGQPVPLPARLAETSHAE